MKTTPIQTTAPLAEGMITKISPFRKVFILFLAFVFSCDSQEIAPVNDQATFLEFTSNGQTLPAFIHTSTRKVRLEIDHDVDITTLTPEFELPEGFIAEVNGKEQISGSSVVDFTKPVVYKLKDRKNNTVSTWEVAVQQVSCKILIDASHDGGVWWFPQSEATGFDPGKPHQGQNFANALREKGFDVTELGRGKELTEEMFFGHYIVIRAGGFQAYTNNELNVYTNLINRGMNLVFFTDHKKYDPVDELGDLLGVQFKGIANGNITRYADHEITNSLQSMNYIAGSVLVNAGTNPAIEVLGWLGPEDYADLNMNEIRDVNEPFAPPVMGVLQYPNSRIFFLGDMNCIEIQPQPFVDNLVNWMGSCMSW